jgi:hypothetical protein
VTFGRSPSDHEVFFLMGKVNVIGQDSYKSLPVGSDVDSDYMGKVQRLSEHRSMVPRSHPYTILT